MIRISPSRLDGFDYYLNGEFKDVTLYEQLVRECNLEPTNIAMLQGSAFHKHLELNGKTPIDYRGVEWHFKDKTSKNIDVPAPFLRECRLKRQVDIGGVPVIFSGILDGLSGTRAYEYKTAKSISLDKYIDSWQWRAYMFMQREIAIVEYHIFKVKLELEVDKETKDFADDGRNVVAVGDKRPTLSYSDHETFEACRYYDLDDDVTGFCQRYVDFLLNCEKQRLIERYFNEYGNMYWKPGPEFEALNV